VGRLTPHVLRSFEQFECEVGIMIDAPQSFLAKDDPFNMADYKIKNWVKGTIWREMHFQGKTIAQIAKSESVGLSYVHRLIDQSFDVR